MNRIMKNKMQWGNIVQKFGTPIMLAALFLFFSLSSEYFCTPNNLINILRQVSITGIITLGMTFVMLTGGIDLSVSAVVGLSSIITAYCMAELGWNMFISIILALLVGAAVGILNGFFVTYVKIPALIATLGVQTSVRGICYIITGGYTVYGFPEEFSFIGKGYIGVIPVPIIIMVIVLGVGWFVLTNTRYGRYLYAIGGNKEAARLAGIKVNKNLMLTYTYSGALAALAGIIELSRLNSGQPNAGDGYEMTVITSVALGGISVSGGEGKFSGVFFGILIMGVLSNGLTMMNVPTYYQQVIKGAVLLFAVGLDQVLKLNLLSRDRKAEV